MPLARQPPKWAELNNLILWLVCSVDGVVPFGALDPPGPAVTGSFVAPGQRRRPRAGRRDSREATADAGTSRPMPATGSPELTNIEATALMERNCGSRSSCGSCFPAGLLSGWSRHFPLRESPQFFSARASWSRPVLNASLEHSAHHGATVSLAAFQSLRSECGLHVLGAGSSAPVAVLDRDHRDGGVAEQGEEPVAVPAARGAHLGYTRLRHRTRFAHEDQAADAPRGHGQQSLFESAARGRIPHAVARRPFFQVHDSIMRHGQALSGTRLATVAPPAPHAASSTPPSQ